MEEKRASGIGVVIVILVIAIAIICAMGYYIYTTRVNENSEIASLKTQLSDVQSQNNSYKDKIDKITEVLNENTKQEEKKEEEKKEEPEKEEAKKEYEDVILEGLYTYGTPSDYAIKFYKDGRVESMGVVSTSYGKYETIRKDLILVHYTEADEYDSENDRVTGNKVKIDTYEIVYVDSNGYLHTMYLNDNDNNLLYPEKIASEKIAN